MSLITNFKKGDIISPLKTRKRTNGYTITGLIRAEVLNVKNHSRYASSRHDICLTIKVLEGYHGSQRVKNTHAINVYSNAFQLADKDYYELW